MADNGGNEALILGLATILQQATSALAALQPGGNTPNQAHAASGLASCADAIAQLTSQLTNQQPPSAPVVDEQSSSIWAASSNPSVPNVPAGVESFGDWPAVEELNLGPEISQAWASEDVTHPEVSIYLEEHGLEAWVGEILDLLSPSQRAAVMNVPMNLGRARNINGIVVSRIKQAVPLDQRLGVFVHINGLGEVLKRLSLLTRQLIMKDISATQGIRNSSGVVMTRVKQFVDVGELMTIFIDINGIDNTVQEELLSMTAEQQAAVIGTGIYLQNVRNASTAVRSRMRNVLAGLDAFGKGAGKGRQ